MLWHESLHFRQTLMRSVQYFHVNSPLLKSKLGNVEASLIEISAFEDKYPRRFWHSGRKGHFNLSKVHFRSHQSLKTKVVTYLHSLVLIALVQSRELQFFTCWFKWDTISTSPFKIPPPPASLLLFPQFIQLPLLFISSLSILPCPFSFGLHSKYYLCPEGSWVLQCPSAIVVHQQIRKGLN